jgi:hypothetical protein
MSTICARVEVVEASSQASKAMSQPANTAA